MTEPDIGGLKQYIEILFSGLEKTIQRLSTQIDAQGTMIHSIEINTTKSVTELQAAVRNLSARLDHDEIENANREAARVESDVNLGKRIAASETELRNFIEQQKILNTTQSERNDRSDKRNDRIIALLWSAIGLVVTLIITSLWNSLL